MPVILGQTASLSTFPLGVPEALRLEGEGKIILMNYVQKTVNREGSRLLTFKAILMRWKTYAGENGLQPVVDWQLGFAPCFY